MRISDWSSDVCSSDLEWRISAVPFFDRHHGRFTGYRGTARRPRADESATHLRANPGLYGSGLAPDSLRQLVHELRTPPNALVGLDRTSVVSGKRVSVRVDLGGRRIIKKKTKKN